VKIRAWLWAVVAVGLLFTVAGGFIRGLFSTMARRVATGVALTLMVGVLAAPSPSRAEPFFVEMPDGSFKRCGNLDFKEARGEWRMRGCAAIGALFVAPPTPRPTSTPSPSRTPRPSPTEQCAGGCMTWDPVTDTVKCQRPCPW